MRNKQNEENRKACASLPAEQLCRAEGLRQEEAEDAQRSKYGSNELQKARKDTVFFRVRRAFLNPFSVVLLVLAVISCFVDIIFAPSPNYITVMIISVMLVVSGCVRLTQELKSKKVTDQLLKLVDTAVCVKRDGTWVRLDAPELVVGDLVRLSAGERVPADIRLAKVQDCFLSESAVTGESELREKTAEPVTGEPRKIRDYQNIAFCGTTVVNGSFEGIVVAVGNNTLYGETVPAGGAGKSRAMTRVQTPLPGC